MSDTYVIITMAQSPDVGGLLMLILIGHSHIYSTQVHGSKEEYGQLDHLPEALLLVGIWCPPPVGLLKFSSAKPQSDSIL